MPVQLWTETSSWSASVYWFVLFPSACQPSEETERQHVIFTKVTIYFTYLFYLRWKVLGLHPKGTFLLTLKIYGQYQHTCKTLKAVSPELGFSSWELSEMHRDVDTDGCTNSLQWSLKCTTRLCSTCSISLAHQGAVAYTESLLSQTVSNYHSFL